MTQVYLDQGSKELLRSLIAKVCKIGKDGRDAEAILTNIETILSSTVRDPGRTIINPGNVGSVAAGFRSFTVTNLGSTNALLDGSDFYPGQSNTFDAGALADTLGGMSYDSQATTLEIITVL